MNSENKTTNGSVENLGSTTVHIETKLGTIEIGFFPDIAPKHVASFIKLARDGFYDGTTFHRVIPNFMVQGGDPLSKDASKRQLHGTGGSDFQLDAEFSDKKHERGILSAARSQNVNSAGSQFFIVHKDSSHLDGQYTVFGKVISGMEVVDKICEVKRDGRDNPIETISMTMKVIDAAAETE